MIDGVTTTISIRKLRIPADQRMAAKALLLALGHGALMQGGQLILHFGPGRNPMFVELQERRDSSSQERLQNTA